MATQAYIWPEDQGGGPVPVLWEAVVVDRPEVNATAERETQVKELLAATWGREMRELVEFEFVSPPDNWDNPNNRNAQESAATDLVVITAPKDD